ncbi:hypothetical protein [Asticcacaulis benevestitus]|uniref:hypothetical protein n=1 Tax=Asticcacaulis benevestitus TaxID=347481 RepID=UPI0003626F2E|nr:hypothetical protein [Asticcacaulis benevestitus]
MGSLLPDSIDVAAGLVFVYLLMSLLTTVVREAIEGMCKRRAVNLEKGLMEILCDHPPEHATSKTAKIGPDFTGYEMLKNFYDHPLTMSLYRGRYTAPNKRALLGGRNLPSYIPSGHFAFVVLDMLASRGGQQTEGRLDPQAILAASRDLPNARLAKMVQFAVSNSGGDIDKARLFMENWYNATMDRVSGWYRHETQTLIFWLALVVCVVLNVNTVVIAQSLYLSPSLRKAVEASSQQYYTTHSTLETSQMTLESSKNPLSALDLPLGWNDTTIDTMNHLFRFCSPKASGGCPEPVKVTKMPKWAGTTWDNLPTKLSASWQNISERTVNLYRGTPSLGDNALFNVLPLISLFMGWLMTAFAVTLGAPFWFDILSKLMTVRSTLKPKDGGGGVTGFDGLGALATAFAPVPAATQTTAQIAYQPALVASSTADPHHDDGDLAYLKALDPAMRPRDA